MKTPRIAQCCASGGLLLACLGTANSALAADAASPHSLKANIALTSNYMFRGISQTNNGPAIQGGFDYTYVPLGLYAGVWASNIDSSSKVIDPATAALPPDQQIVLQNPGYDGASMELDLKAGWAPTFGKLGIDLGYLRYQYPMTKTNANNTNEVHLGVSYDVLGYFTPKATANYSDNFYGLKGAWYYDLTVTVPLPYAISLAGHYGWTQFNNSPNHGGSYNYEDYSVSLSREFYGVTLAVAWVDRNNVSLCAKPFQCGNTAVFTASKSF
jgi:uncharacterized protein (TIGR02001 family)